MLPIAPELLVTIILVALILFQLVDHKILILVIILGVYYVYDYRKIHRSLKETFTSLSDTTEPHHRHIMKNNGYKHTLDINSHTMDPTITGLLRKLRKYRRYNKPSYDRGRTFLIQWLHNIQGLESSVSHPRQIYENAETNYQSALREFQGLSTAGPSLSHGQSLTRRGALTTTPNYQGASTDVGELCKQLHEYCYYRMYNLALTINHDWVAKPNIYKTEISLSDVKGFNTHDPHLLY